MDGDTAMGALIVALALAISAGAGGGIVHLVLHLAHGRHGPAEPGEADPARVLRGGRWIGILERLATTTAILAGYPAAIAVVVAVKGLGRFPELRQGAGVSERFIIGSLTSLLWACVIGLAGVGALGAWVE